MKVRAALILTFLLVLLEKGTAVPFKPKIRARRIWKSLKNAAVVQEKKVAIHLPYVIGTAEGMTLICLALSPNKNRERRTAQSRTLSIFQGVVQSQLPARVIMVMNAIVIALWHVLPPIWDQLEYQNTSGINFMKKNFSRSSNPTERKARPHTLLTAGFSHADWQHFSGNMAALYFFCPRIVDRLGYRAFSFFYVCSIYGSIIFDELFFSKLISTKKYNYGLGASGAISALMTFYCLAFPSTEFEVDGKYYSAPVCAALWALEDFLAIQKQDGIGHGVHLGGYLFGLLVWSLGRILDVAKPYRVVLKPPLELLRMGAIFGLGWCAALLAYNRG